MKAVQPYGCCLHCTACPTSDGHPVPCVSCQQPRMTADQLVAQAMNRESSGGGVNAVGHAAKDAPTDGASGSSGVPAPPPATTVVSWSDRYERTHPPARRWWDLRPTAVSGG